MSDADDHRADPEEVFSAVANETRFDILRTVWDLTKTGSGDGSATFAAVRAETGVQDSGQFNYHLQELSPRFVRKTEEGYEATHAGSQLVARSSPASTPTTRRRSSRNRSGTVRTAVGPSRRGTPTGRCRSNASTAR